MLGRLATQERSTVVFDLEVRPTAWIGGDFVGRSITAAAWVWQSERVPHSVLITREDTSNERVVAAIVDAIEEADVVTGHFIRGFDFPILSAEVQRHGMEPLGPILSLDTKSDRKLTEGFSQSLENLVARFELDHPKVPMHEPWWEEYNLWQTPRSVEWVRTRVEGDIMSTLDLLEYGYQYRHFKGPKIWSPDSSRMPKYRG